VYTVRAGSLVGFRVLGMRRLSTCRAWIARVYGTVDNVLRCLLLMIAYLSCLTRCGVDAGGTGDHDSREVNLPFVKKQTVNFAVIPKVLVLVKVLPGSTEHHGNNMFLASTACRRPSLHHELLILLAISQEPIRVLPYETVAQSWI